MQQGRELPLYPCHLSLFPMFLVAPFVNAVEPVLQQARLLLPL